MCSASFFNSLSKDTHKRDLCVLLLECVLFISSRPFPVRPPTLKQAVIHGQNYPTFDHLPTNQRRSNEFQKNHFTFRFDHARINHRWTKTVSFGRGQKGRDTRRASSKP